MYTEPIDLYTRMLQIRQCELQLNKAFANNQFPGFIHSYLGQEACAVGICSNLNDEDYIISNHRARGHYLAKGMALKPMMAEMFSRETGICGGRGGEMHAADPALGILGGNGIVGGGLPYAAGAAYSALLEGKDRVAVAFFGEGAANNGSFAETMNIAAAWKLPLILVCENNLYAEMTPFADTTVEVDVAKRALGYGLPGEIADGNDVLAVQKAGLKAVKRARKGDGPTLLELKTYRWGGHFEGDPKKYRSKEEEADWKAKCPVKRFRELLNSKFKISIKKLDAMEQEVTAEIADAVQYALDSPLAKPETVLDHVYAE